MDREPCTLNTVLKEFLQNLKALGSSLFNIFFILDTKGAMLRQRLLLGFFSLFWLVFGLLLLDSTGWIEKMGKSFQYLLTFPRPVENPILDFLFTLYDGFFDASIMRLLPLLIAPFVFAYQASFRYLSDIYELKDESIAAKFIWQAAFGSKYHEISIIEGKIAEKDLNSPIVKIGGPGRIKVDLCSAVLFEKPSGRPHVIGPVYSPPQKLNQLQKLVSWLSKKLFPKPAGIVIEGFERIRGIKDLREEALAPIDVSAYTRDGIKVIAKDVRMVYSIWRGTPSEEELKTIYPYRKEAIPHFFYSKEISTNDLGKQSHGFIPNNTMQVIVGEALSNFISQHSLSDFIMAVGKPEKDALKNRAKDYQKEKDILERETGIEPDLSDKQFEVPNSTQRTDANPLFTKFSEDFNANNKKKGVVLHWLGAGTWVIPEQSISEKNKEAMILSKENAKNGSEETLKKAENQEKLQELARLIRKIPLDAEKIIYAQNSFRESIVTEILESYIELIKNAHEIASAYEIEYNDVQDILLIDASKRIYKTIYDAHWVGKAPPPPLG